MKTINIHGKEYVEVNERIKFFRKHYTDWSLTSEILELTENRCVIKSTVHNDIGYAVSTGIAYETLTKVGVNKTSFIENCETSANGRALGNLGIGIDNSIASAEEVKYAIEQDKPKEKEKLSGSKYQAMIIAIGEGKADLVKKRMQSYKLTKTQKDKLEELINTNLNK